jgi:hypothetical protein
MGRRATASSFVMHRPPFRLRVSCSVSSSVRVQPAVRRGLDYRSTRFLRLLVMALPWMNERSGSLENRNGDGEETAP